MKESTEPIPLKYIWNKYFSLIDGVLSKKSISLYAQEFKNFCSWANMKDILYVHQVTPQITEQYIMFSYSIRRAAPFEIQTLRRMWDIVFPNKDNPWRIKLFNLVRINTPRPMTHRPFTFREITKLFREFDETLRNAMMFGYWYGMRIGSICSLQWKDFKSWRYSGKFVHLPLKTARCKPRYLELPIVPQIGDVLSYLDRTSPYLFPKLNEIYNTTSSGISRLIGNAIDKCNIKDSLIGIASAHSFRTTFITKMDEAGAPVYITDSITGHAPRDMHGLYSKPSVHSKRKWILKALKPIPVDKAIL